MAGLDVYVRWMIRRDMDEVVAIEKLNTSDAWPESKFEHHLRRRNTIGMVAEWKECVAGFMVYELHKHHMHLINIAVEPRNQRAGIGTALMDKMVSKLSRERRNRILTEVSEDNTDAHLFFKACGFVATDVVNNWFGNERDAYLFERRHRVAQGVT